MKVKIKRFDKNLPLPVYKTAVCSCARFGKAEKKMTVVPVKIAYVPLNIALQVPADSFVLVAARRLFASEGSNADQWNWDW
jgi:dUTPase